MKKALFILALFLAKNYEAKIEIFKAFKIIKIEGQLKETVTKELKTKYWKPKTSNNQNEIEIEITYEIYEFLDHITVKGKIKIQNKEKVFIIKVPHSKTSHWRHDSKIIRAIARTININAQVLNKSLKKRKK